MRFTKQRILIVATNELGVKKTEVHVEAMVAGGTGLAYHPFLYKRGKPGYTSITHIASGMQVGDEFPDDEEFAQKFIRHLVTLLDWRQPGAEIQKNISRAFLEEEQRKLMVLPIQEKLF